MSFPAPAKDVDGKFASTNAAVDAFQTSSFVSCCRQLLPSIREGFRKQGHHDSLPVDVLSFLCSYIKISYDRAQQLWTRYNVDIFGRELDSSDHLVGRLASQTAATSYLQRFGLRQYRQLLSRPLLSELCVYLPAAVTLDVNFKSCLFCNRKLVYKPPVRGVLYSIRFGVLPVLCPSLYCNG